MIRISLSREEAIACLVLLEKTKRELYGWERSVYDKLLKAIGWEGRLRAIKENR